MTTDIEHPGKAPGTRNKRGYFTDSDLVATRAAKDGRPPLARRVGFHADGRGLYLHVAAHGARRWVARLMVAGVRRDFALGMVEDVSLAQARGKLDALRSAKANGATVDDIEAIHRKATGRDRPLVKPIITFAHVAGETYRSRLPSLTNEKYKVQ